MRSATLCICVHELYWHKDCWKTDGLSPDAGWYGGAAVPEGRSECTGRGACIVQTPFRWVENSTLLPFQHLLSNVGERFYLGHNKHCTNLPLAAFHGSYTRLDKSPPRLKKSPPRVPSQFSCDITAPSRAGPFARARAFPPVVCCSAASAYGAYCPRPTPLSLSTANSLPALPPSNGCV